MSNLSLSSFLFWLRVLVSSTDVMISALSVSLCSPLRWCQRSTRLLQPSSKTNSTEDVSTKNCRLKAPDIVCPKSARLKGEFREYACSLDSGSLGSAGISAVLSRERREINSNCTTLIEYWIDSTRSQTKNLCWMSIYKRRKLNGYPKALNPVQLHEATYKGISRKSLS